MIQELKNIENTMLPALLDKPEVWHSLDVNYHPPRVQRLWTQVGKKRLSLHVIHPCTAEEALYHPHPWASAIHIISGKYEMGLGVKDSPGFKGLHKFLNGEPTIGEKFVRIDKNEKQYRFIREISKTILVAGSYYEMLDKKGWHYVRPLDEPSISIMLMDEPWDNSEEEEGLPKPEEKLSEMDNETIVSILQKIKGILK